MQGGNIAGILYTEDDFLGRGAWSLTSALYDSYSLELVHRVTLDQHEMLNYPRLQPANRVDGTISFFAFKVYGFAQSSNSTL